MPRLARYLLLATLPLGFGCGRPAEQFTIIVIPKGLTHEHWQSVRRGAERCAADLLAEEGVSIRVIFDGPLRERDAIEQMRIVDRRVATGAHGIILAPQHSKTMTACVKRAADAGVPVVLLDSGLVETDHAVKFVATNNYNGGRLAGEHLLKLLADQGKTKPRLILFRYAVGSEATDQREKGFEDAVREKCADAVWLSTDKYAGATRDSAMREAGPLVLQFKDQVDGIFAPNESSAVGMTDVLRSQGLAKKVVVMGFDASKPLLQAIQEGEIAGSILQDPYRMGYLSTWCCVRHLLGEDVSAGRSQFDQWTGEFLITKENVTALATIGLYDKDEQAKRTIDKPRFPMRGAK